MQQLLPAITALGFSVFRVTQVETLRQLVGTRSAASGVDLISACAAAGDRACGDALDTWLRVEEARRQAGGTASVQLPSAALLLEEHTDLTRQMSMLVLGPTLAMMALCFVLGWRWLIWFAVSVTVIGARLIAASYQSLMLSLSLLLYACIAFSRSFISLGSRLSCLSSRRRLDELDAILKATADVQADRSYSEWLETAAARDELSGAAAWRRDAEGDGEAAAHEAQLEMAKRAGGRVRCSGFDPLHLLHLLFRRPLHLRV